MSIKSKFVIVSGVLTQSDSLGYTKFMNNVIRIMELREISTCMF